MKRRRVKLADLSDAVRSFFAQTEEDDEPVMIDLEDEQGRARYGVIPYDQVTPEQRAKADAGLERLWIHTDAAMKETGVSVDDIERAVFEDDG